MRFSLFTPRDLPDIILIGYLLFSTVRPSSETYASSSFKRVLSSIKNVYGVCMTKLSEAS